MTNFTQYTIESASQESQPLLEGAQKAFGFIPNLLSTLAEAPAALKAYINIADTFGKSSLNAVEQQVVLLATSVENTCEYCVAAHSVMAKNMAKADAAIVEALRNGEELPDAKLNALANFTRAAVVERGFVSEQALSAFYAAGYNKANVLEVITGIAQKTISNYSNHIAGVPVDAQFASQTWSAPSSSKAA